MSVLCQAWTDCSVVEIDRWEHLFTQSWGIWMGSPKVWAPFLMIKQVEASAGDISRLSWLFCFPWTIYLERIFTEAAFPLCILAYMILSRCSENPRAYLSFPWNIFLILSRVFFPASGRTLTLLFAHPDRSPGLVPDGTVYHRGRRGHGRPGQICGPLPWLLQLCLWGVGEEQPTTWGEIPVGSF